MPVLTDMALLPHTDLISQMRQEKFSYANIANNITAQLGVERGVSARSVRRFCAENCQKRNALTTQQLQVEMASAINEVRTVI